MIEFTSISISILVILIIILVYHLYLVWQIDADHNGIITEEEMKKYKLPHSKNVKNSFLSGAVRGLILGALVTQNPVGSMKYGLIMGLMNPLLLFFEYKYC